MCTLRERLIKRYAKLIFSDIDDVGENTLKITDRVMINYTNYTVYIDEKAISKQYCLETHPMSFTLIYLAHFETLNELKDHVREMVKTAPYQGV